MGWALHYIGDLTQPYHTEPLPGVSPLSALWSVITGRTDEVIQLVSNRHGVIESYQYRRMADLMDQGARHPCCRALPDHRPPVSCPGGLSPT